MVSFYILMLLGIVAFHGSLASISEHREYSEAWEMFVDFNNSIHTTDDNFLSVCMDQSLMSSKPKWQTFDFSLTRVKTLLRGLAPAYLRFGGTTADSVLFTGLSSSTFQDIGLKPDLVVMNGTDLDSLVKLTTLTGLRYLHELNLQWRYGYQWDPTNAIQMLEYIKKKGYGDNIDFELGNEPFNFAHIGHIPLNGTQIGKDYITLAKLLHKYNFKQNKLVGPDDTFSTPGDLIKLFADTAGNYVDAITFHHYYFNGVTATVEDYINPANFDVLDRALTMATDVMKTTSVARKPLWLGETSDAYNSGTANVSDRYVGGFLWLDKLGLSAQMGIAVVMRQTFYGGNYGLIGKDLMPNPDYWLSYIYKELVGHKVLNVTLKSFRTDSPDVNKTTRVYAHCSKSQYDATSGVVVFALNVDSNSSLLILPRELTHQRTEVYLLSPSVSNLTSRDVSLNGQHLVMPNDSNLPKLTPKILNVTSSVEIPPLSMIFYVFPSAKNITACQK